MKIACEHCGSSDARELYPDGHSHCFAVNCPAPHVAGESGNGAATPATPPARGLLSIAEFKPLVSRKLNEETCRHFGYGIAEHRGERVQVAPYCDDVGRVIAQKIRTKDKHFEVLGSGKRMGLFGQHLWRDGGKMVVVTEGEIDAMSVSQLQENKWPVVSLPNGAASAAKSIAASSEWLERFERVVLMFDMDEPGQAAALAAAQALSPGRAYIAHLPLKDANDMLVAGRGKEVISAIWGARRFRPDGLIQGEDLWQRVLNHTTARSITLPHTGLQRMTRGIRAGELIVLAAGTGSGKSTFCRELAAAFLAGGEKVGYIGLEEGVRRSTLGILSVALSKPLHLMDDAAVATAEVRQAFERIQDNLVLYDHVGSLQAENLLSRMRFMARGEGCSVLILDHLSIVASGLDGEFDERRELDRVMTKLAGFVNEVSIAVIVVTHLSRREGKSHEKGREVSLADLRGSHGIAQLAHAVVSLERDQQSTTDANVVTVRVMKNRFAGETGIAGFLRYDNETGRLTEYAAAFESAEEPATEGAFA